MFNFKYEHIYNVINLHYFNHVNLFINLILNVCRNVTALSLHSPITSCCWTPETGCLWYNQCSPTTYIPSLPLMKKKGERNVIPTRILLLEQSLIPFVKKKNWHSLIHGFVFFFNWHNCFKVFIQLLWSKEVDCIIGRCNGACLSVSSILSFGCYVFKNDIFCYSYSWIKHRLKIWSITIFLWRNYHIKWSANFRLLAHHLKM